MKTDLKIEVECLGKALQGEGKIKSTMPEHDYPVFAEALKQSVVEIDEPDCAACIDGRCVKCLKNGAPGRNRPKKAGASISTFVMMGMGDKNYLDGLEDTAHDADDLYERSAELQDFLGNKESGHEDCGAAMGTVNHVRGVANAGDDNPNVIIAKSLVANEFPRLENEGISIDELFKNIRNNAAGLAYVLESRRWDGAAYVDRLAQREPENVEILETKDDEVNGHAEDAIVFVDGLVDDDLRPLHTIDKDLLKEKTGREAFIVNLNELRRDAYKLGSTTRQKAQLLLSALAHHAAGAYPKLADGSQAIFVVNIR